MQMNVTGWSHKHGDFNGNPYNYVVIYCISRMEQKDTQRGSAGIDMRGDPSIVEKLQKMDFSTSLICEVTTEARATGKGQFVETVVSVSALPQEKAFIQAPK